VAIQQHAVRFNLSNCHTHRLGLYARQNGHREAGVREDRIDNVARVVIVVYKQDATAMLHPTHGRVV
jgi:hypothetical protein